MAEEADKRKKIEEQDSYGKLIKSFLALSV
jgi:hypothetical protein